MLKASRRAAYVTKKAPLEWILGGVQVCMMIRDVAYIARDQANAARDRMFLQARSSPPDRLSPMACDRVVGV